jgi:hypothetical protein
VGNTPSGYNENPTDNTYGIIRGRAKSSVSVQVKSRFYTHIGRDVPEGLWGSHAHGHMPMIQSLALSQASLPDLTRRRRNSCPRAIVKDHDKNTYI